MKTSMMNHYSPPQEINKVEKTERAPLAIAQTFFKKINGRSEENFAGKLPRNPLSPNCVNSQQKSWWGSLYNVDPIAIPEGMKDPMSALKRVLSTAKSPSFDSEKMKLVEERENYLHYEYTVTISSGPLKGIYIDDVDIYFDAKKWHFDIRSASRTGFRDAVHLDFSLPGANKKRVEAIRDHFTKMVF